MSMYYAAVRLGLSGWVRNLRNGSVEALAQGEDAAVNEFIAWAHKGPEAARVDNVDVIEGSGDYVNFEIKDTL